MRKSSSFAQSNKSWNDLSLNSKKSIGCLMFLIKESKATTPEEWAHYYFKSGESRAIQKQRGVKGNEIDYEYGRTSNDLSVIAKKLQASLKCTFKTAYNYVYIRVIDETWIGYERELNALKSINQTISELSNARAYEVSYNMDIRYAIDFEVKKDNSLIFAIQLKSEVYKKSSNPGTLDAKRINARKNKDYKNEFGSDVLYLYVDYSNKIINLGELVIWIKKYIDEQKTP